MAEFINTIDVLGDDAVVDSIIDRSITEFKDNKIENVGSYAFYECVNLERVELPNVVTIDNQAFSECTALTSLSIPSVTNIGSNNFSSDSFAGCSNLESFDAPELSVLKGGVLSRCNKLVEVNLPKVTIIFDGGIGSDSLNLLDLPSCTVLRGSSLAVCRSLNALILRVTNQICTLDNMNALTYTPIVAGTGYVYVPRDLVDSYKTATNWSTYATQFRALEDYTVDGTITGKFAFANIRYVLEHVTSSNTETYVTGSYSTVLAIKGVNPVVSIIMDGVDITNDVYNEETGEIVIPEVSGDIVITATSQIDYTNMPTLYELPEATSFNGTSDYIDTGIKLFDTAKDFTIVCSADFSALASGICLFHCMNEAAPYPGVSLDGNSGVRICYIGDRSVTTSISNKADVKVLALRFKAGALDAIRYKNASGEIVTVAHNTTAKYAEVTQNLLLGAYQTTAGVKGRYYKGTINSFVVYDLYLDENMIEYALTVA